VPLDLQLDGRSVLLLGADAGTAATVHALMRDGAVVSIDPGADSSDGAAPTMPTSTLDLVERGLVRMAPGADRDAFDVVIRARASAATDAPEGGTAASRSSTSGLSGPGRVTLVGGGPGDPGLMPAAGLDAIRGADVVVHDRLAPLAVLSQARSDAVVVDVGKIPRGEFTPQERINEIIVEHALAGRDVVRLKGGDNFVFGRGGEEAEACTVAGVPVTVVPGISSSIAGPALAGIPVTHRSLVQGFTVVSGHVAPGDPRSTLDWGAIARTNTTIVVLMGVATLGAIADELIAQGLPPETPAAVVADAALPSMRTVRAALSDIAKAASRGGLGAPAVAVIGAVAALDVLAAGRSGVGETGEIR
jgi:uroporphyrin-III C-methyltransferase